MKYPVPALWRASATTVLDGDTVRLLIDRGLDDYTRVTVRLKNVFAPEVGKVGGQETRNFVLGWLTDHDDGSDWPFLLETFRTPRSDTEVVTLSRFVGVLTASDGSVLNKDVQAYVDERGWPGGIGA